MINNSDMSIGNINDPCVPGISACQRNDLTESFVYVPTAE